MMFGPIGDAVQWLSLHTAPLWKPLLQAWMEWRYKS
ncbi:hypothetical protein MLGJGCBP_01005 [Rhodococcus sp. T7]|nr:hypothetical protein MLGJGCBP_01005 [Rhodococcus sp. T7]